jgi:hypothetical protein
VSNPEDGDLCEVSGRACAARVIELSVLQKFATPRPAHICGDVIGSLPSVPRDVPAAD